MRRGKYRSPLDCGIHYSRNLPGHYLGAPLVTLEGPPKAGKTETMFELAQIINHIGCKAEVFLMSAYIPQCIRGVTRDGYDSYSQALRALAALSKLYHNKIKDYLEHDTIVIVDNWFDYIIHHCGLNEEQITTIDCGDIILMNRNYFKYYLPDSNIKNPDEDMKTIIDSYQTVPSGYNVPTGYYKNFRLEPIRNNAHINGSWDCFGRHHYGSVIFNNTKHTAKENALLITSNLAMEGALKNVSYSYDSVTGRCAFWRTRATIQL